MHDRAAHRLTPRLLILHCPAGGGHRAAAEALAEHAADWGLEAEVVDALSLTPRWFARGYVETHLKSTQHTPWFYGLGYRRLNRRHPVTDRIRRRMDQAVGGMLRRYVEARQPDAVIATHFFPLSVLGAARLSGRLQAPLIGVVTDFAAHAFWAEPGVDLFCATAGGAALDLARHGAPRPYVIETGIPVRRAFARIRPLGDKQMHHGRPPGALNVLLTSGGFGIGPLAAAVRSFAGYPHLKLTVVCGASDERVEQVRAAAGGVNARIIGFERNMAARLAEAHLVAGKPGGLTVSESLACGRPMALFGTCPGQEQHNEDWLRLNGAAVAIEPARAAAEIERLRASGALEAMAEAARRLGTPRAAEHVLAATFRLLGQPLAA